MNNNRRGETPLRWQWLQWFSVFLTHDVVAQKMFSCSHSPTAEEWMFALGDFRHVDMYQQFIETADCHSPAHEANAIFAVLDENALLSDAYYAYRSELSRHNELNGRPVNEYVHFGVVMSFQIFGLLLQEWIDWVFSELTCSNPTDLYSCVLGYASEESVYTSFTSLMSRDWSHFGDPEGIEIKNWYVFLTQHTHNNRSLYDCLRNAPHEDAAETEQKNHDNENCNQNDEKDKEDENDSGNQINLLELDNVLDKSWYDEPSVASSQRISVRQYLEDIKNDPRVEKSIRDQAEDLYNRVKDDQNQQYQQLHGDIPDDTSSITRSPETLLGYRVPPQQ
jgi:hypothetical protein